MGEREEMELWNWDALRRQQRREFQALPLRDKLLIVEQMSEVSAYFRMRRVARGLPVNKPFRDSC
jgi:hypothetical protein